MVSGIRTPLYGMAVYWPLCTRPVGHTMLNHMGFCSCFEGMQVQGHIRHQFRIQHYHELKGTTLGCKIRLNIYNIWAKKVVSCSIKLYLVDNLFWGCLQFLVGTHIRVYVVQHCIELRVHRHLGRDFDMFHFGKPTMRHILRRQHIPLDDNLSKDCPELQYHIRKMLYAHGLHNGLRFHNELVNILLCMNHFRNFRRLDNHCCCDIEL